MKYYKKLEGENVYLSPINVEDAKDYIDWFTDFRTTDGIKQSRNLLNIESETEWITQTLKEGRPEFAIVKKDNNEMIGNCGFMKISQIDGTAEIGIFIGKEENRNKGFGTESINLLLDWGFNYLNLHNIELGVFSFNERAINCYKKLGFKEYGRRRECYYLNGKYYDLVRLDMLKDEFKGDFIKNKVIY